MRACLGRLPYGSLKGKEADMGEKDVSEQQQVAADQAQEIDPEAPVAKEPASDWSEKQSQEIEDTGQAAFGAGELPE